MLDIIQGFWHGPLTPMEIMCMRSFVKQGHPFHLYTYKAVRDLPDGVEVKSAGDLVPLTAIEQFQNLANFSDYFRFELLYQMGGWWVDLDTYCLRPFSDFDPFVFATQFTGDHDEVAAGIIRAPKGSTFMRCCLKRVKLIDAKTCSWASLGPAVVLQVVEELQYQRFVQPHSIFCPLHFYEAPENVFGLTSDKAQFGHETKAVHLWNEESRRAGIDKYRTYPGSLFARLQREAAQ